MNVRHTRGVVTVVEALSFPYTSSNAVIVQLSWGEAKQIALGLQQIGSLAAQNYPALEYLREALDNELR